MNKGESYMLDPGLARRLGKDSDKVLSSLSRIGTKLPVLQVNLGVCSRGSYFEISGNEILMDFRDKAPSEIDSVISALSSMCSSADGQRVCDLLSDALLVVMAKEAETNG